MDGEKWQQSKHLFLIVQMGKSVLHFSFLTKGVGDNLVLQADGINLLTLWSLC